MLPVDLGSPTRRKLAPARSCLLKDAHVSGIDGTPSSSNYAEPFCYQLTRPNRAPGGRNVGRARGDIGASGIRIHELHVDNKDVAESFDALSDDQRDSAI
jgi:hypothetical protein